MDNCRENCISWKQQNCRGSRKGKGNTIDLAHFTGINSQSDCLKNFLEMEALIGKQYTEVFVTTGMSSGLGVAAGIAIKGLVEARFANKFISGAKNKGAVGWVAAGMVAGGVVVYSLYSAAGQLARLEEESEWWQDWFEEC